MLGVDAVGRRVARLEDLSAGLGKEIQAWERGEDPLLYLERRALLIGLRALRSGAESARLALNKALIRLKAPPARPD